MNKCYKHNAGKESGVKEVHFLSSECPLCKAISGFEANKENFSEEVVGLFGKVDYNKDYNYKQNR